MPRVLSPSIGAILFPIGTLVVGCVLNKDGLDEGAPVDNRPDTAIADFATATDAIGDDSILDAAGDDTFAVDSGTFDADVAVDTGLDGDGGSGAVLSITGELVPLMANVSLTTFGKLDWAHWGFGDATAFNSKTSAGLIGRGATLSAAAATYNNYKVRFTWSDGDPTAAASDVAWGLLQTAELDGFTFTVRGDEKATRTLLLYASCSICGGTVSVSLTDTSVPTTTAAIPPAPTTAPQHPLLYTIKFRPLSAGASLAVTLRRASGAGNISLLAAAVQ